MSAAGKGFYYKRLREAGVPLERHFRDYTLDELTAAHAAAVEAGLLQEPTMAELAELNEKVHRAKVRKATTEASKLLQQQQQEQTSHSDVPDVPLAEPELRMPPAQSVPHAQRDPNEMAGQRQNSKDADEPIRIDEHGRVWLQEEVRKPAYPKPRGRRVLRYMDPGTKQATIVSGEYTETFEVSGDPRNARPAEIKITLPSYQVGIYRDPRFPFKVITYNGQNGFDRADVAEYYGGSELVPEGVKRIYVENVLCYDIRTTIRAIQAEYRQHVLAGNIQ